MENGGYIAEFEKQVIGECLVESGADARLCAIRELKPSDFSVPSYRVIFNAMLSLFQQGKPIDALTVLSEIVPEERNEYKRILYETAAQIFSVKNYPEHIKLVKEAGTLRRVEGRVRDIAAAVEYGGDIEQIMEMSASLNDAFADYGNECRQTVSEGLSEVIGEIGKKRQYFRTGFRLVDYTLHISRGYYIVIGGRPSTGKTALSLQMAMNMAEKHNVAYFSLETSTKTLSERMLACFSGTDYGKIRKGELTEQDKQRLSDIVLPRAKQLKLTLVNAAGWTVERIKAEAIQLKAEVVFIDYLGLIKPSKDISSQYEAVTRLSVDLHTMAQSTGIVTITLCQLNRAGKEEPDLTSLRDSGQIEQDADAVILLHTPNKDNPVEKDINIEKNKDGELGKVKMNFIGNKQRFVSPEDDRGEPVPPGYFTADTVTNAPVDLDVDDLPF